MSFCLTNAPAQCTYSMQQNSSPKFCKDKPWIAIIHNKITWKPTQKLEKKKKLYKNHNKNQYLLPTHHNYLCTPQCIQSWTSRYSQFRLTQHPSLIKTKPTRTNPKPMSQKLGFHNPLSLKNCPQNFLHKWDRRSEDNDNHTNTLIVCMCMINLKFVW